MKKTARTKTNSLLALTAALLLLFLLFCTGACSAEGVAYDAGEKDAYYLTVDDAESQNAEGYNATERKIVETIDISLQTLEYDALLQGVKAKIGELGGYISASYSTGNQINAEASSRYADLTVRIPTAETDSFLSYLEEAGTVYRKSMETKDITLEYVDVESRLVALKAEKAKLETLMEEAKTVSEALEIQKYLTDVIAEIEQYQRTLNSYDGEVNYTTITLSVREVERITEGEEKGVFARIRENLGDGVVNVWHILEEIFVFLVSAVPYLLIPAGIFAVVLILISKSGKAHRHSGTEEKK